MTSGNKFNNLNAKCRVLVAPLEWGLGHAARCIPIIKELIFLNCEVLIAAEGATFLLLQQEFPELKFLPLRGYRIKYSRKKYFLPWKIFIQLPKIIFAIYNEHRWLKKIIEQHQINAVISDNRFGLYTKKIPCIYITHQLRIKTGNLVTETIAEKINYHFIKKYNQCWVPDFEKNSLAGDLSHRQKMHQNIQYMGALSRFELKEKIQKKYEILISVSGPEPQRSVFERQVLNDLKSYPGSVLFIRGLPANEDLLKSPNPLIEIKNHLVAKEFNEAVLASDIIISRCGYTTIMDLIKLKKKAILIPTPGQTEQEYLAKYLMGKKIFYTICQKDFFIQDALKQAFSFQFELPDYEMNFYKKVIGQFVRSL